MTDGTGMHAVYWVPQHPDPLSRFGMAWTGWCPDTAERRRRRPSPESGLDLRTITRETARHGFHGVLAAPFRLREWQSWALERALSEVADQAREIEFEDLQIAVVDGRVALVPAKGGAALDRLARRVRAAVAPLAAPAGRGGEPSPASVAGHTDVRFCPTASFHMPLTDRMPVASACQMARRLEPLVARHIEGRHLVADIALVSLPNDAIRARIEDRYALADQTEAAGGSFSCRGPRVYEPLPDLTAAFEPVA